MLVLVFLVVDAIQLCRHFILALTDDMKDTKGQLRQGGSRTRPWSTYGTKQLNRAKKYPRQIQHELLHIKVIADCSDEVRKIAFWPLLVFGVMLLTRLPVFANPGVPWPKALLAATVFAIVMVCALALRRSARIGRQRVLLRLQDGLVLIEELLHWF